ncbi:hypothetical protein K8638_06850 [Myxococcus sp. RHST-1-4]|nr:hypothetical protein [Myxococcus sp. RHSTA-1-4]
MPGHAPDLIPEEGCNGVVKAELRNATPDSVAELRAQARASFVRLGYRHAFPADLAVHAGKAWLGFGVHWDSPRNLGTWKTLHVSLRSKDPGFAAVKVGMNDTTPSVQLDVEKYGYVNDGQWRHLSIPLTEFTAAGLNLGAVNAPFLLISGQGAPADRLLLDNLYFTAE